MAERKATNKYYPPDWDPSKSSANTYQRTNHLRKRAKRIDDGILVVRFEMPYNIICSNCDNFIAMGVRYNADKSKVGNYYTTPIYRFRMKCHLCDNYFEIETEPSKFDYKIISGARRQIRYDYSNPIKAEDDLQPGKSTLETGTDKKLKADAMSRLEQKVEDKLTQEAVGATLQQLKEWRDSREEDFKDNQLVRAQYRKRRKDKRLEREKQIKKAKLEKVKMQQIKAMKPESRKSHYMQLSSFAIKSRPRENRNDKINQESNQSIPNRSTKYEPPAGTIKLEPT